MYVCDGLWMGPLILDPNVIKSTQPIYFCGIYMFAQTFSSTPNPPDVIGRS